MDNGAIAQRPQDEHGAIARGETSDNPPGAPLVGEHAKLKEGLEESRETKPPHPGRLLRRPLARTALGVLIGAVVAGSIVWWLNARRFQSTNDAFIDAHMVYVAAQTSGQVIAVDVTDNASVNARQLLVQIEPRTAQNQLAQAKAARDQAQAGLDQALAQLRVDTAREEQAQSQIAAAQAQATNAEREFGRMRALYYVSRSTVSRQQLDQVRAQAKTTNAQLKSASRQAKAAAAQLAVASSQASEAAAQLRGAQAKIGQANINLSYMRIAAPVGGYVAHLSVAAGDYVQPGQQLMAIVPHHVWVRANFKETQIVHMHSGEKGHVTIDACNAGALPAHVVSIQHGAGQAFALLPPQNASGNFVKVVQRVPVKIAIDRMPRHCVVGPGMSVEARVKVH